MTNTTNYWENKWENNDISFHDDFVNPLLMKYLPALKLKIGDTIIVPLCGKTIDMIWLASHGLKVIGIELSPIACKEFFSSQNMTPKITQQEFFTIYEFENIKLFCGDIFNLKPSDLQNISAIYDWKALIALPKETRVNYVNHLISCTGSKINILLITLESKQEVMGPPFSIPDTEIQLHFGKLFHVEKVREELFNPVPDHLVPKGWNDGDVKKTYIIQNT